MQNLPAIFNFRESPVRIIVQPNGEPLFNANDVTGLLGYANGRDAVAKHCRPKGVVKCDTPTAGGMQSLSFLSESNLYRLVMRSDKAEADEVQDWVTEDVLPQIRKTGGYAPAVNLPQTKSEALRQLADSLDREEALTKQLVEAQPAIELVRQVFESEDTMPVAQAAKLLGVGPQKLFVFLRQKRIFMNGTGGQHRNMPYQQYIDDKYFEVKEQPFKTPDGKTRINVKPVVTQKGLEYIRKRLLAAA